MAGHEFEFEELMRYVVAHEDELAKLGCDSLSECLATGKATKHRGPSITKHIVARARGALWNAAQDGLCIGAVEKSDDMTQAVEKLTAFFENKQDELIALQKPN